MTGISLNTFDYVGLLKQRNVCALLKVFGDGKKKEDLAIDGQNLTANHRDFPC